MKPPPRARKTPKRIGEVADEPRRPGGRFVCRWPRAERRQLLRALKALHKTTAPHRDLDLTLLESKVPTRPPSEIRSLVEQLKNQVIATADRLRKRTLAEQRIAKPIEKWTQLAAAVTRSHEEAMSAGFSQMLIVSSTEPCTLKNCHHPSGPARPPAVAPQPSCSVQPRVSGSSNTVRTNVLDAGIPCSRNHPKPRKTRPLQSRTPAPGAVVQTTSPQRDASCVSVPQLLQQPPSTTPPTAVEALITPPASSAALAEGLEDASRIVGGKDMVDFERIYCFLGRIQEPLQSCLTPMESAIVLDLLTSLPEELRLLDCNKLHKHFTQVFQCFSDPKNSKKAKEAFGELKEGLCSRVKEQATPDPLSQQTSAPPREAGSRGEDGMDVPPLNPFMVPLKLLQRKLENSQGSSC